MKRMTGAEVRQSFLDFFAERGHTVVPSASLVPTNDPTLLFTNAGMNQFKDVFLGVGTRPYNRAADAQKCMRVSGKHNDLEDVGRDGTHHTFFEMLGNWSFGDYYKKEAIRWAWEYLTEALGFSEDRIWATVFKDDGGDLGADDEARGFWLSETDIDPEHILYFGRKENFWEMADTGPCGPCSEISVDRGPEACDCQDDPEHECRVNGECGRFVELWNLVFIQYNKEEDGTLHPLPAQHVDTGMGFERLVALLQGVDSNYKTDLFQPIFSRVQEMVGHTDKEVDDHLVAYRVIADHGRAITFLIGDGVLPGNEGRNYVLRMILRRASRFGRQLGFGKPFLAEVAKVVIEMMGEQYPEIEARQEFILTTITQEEERFLRTLDLGLSQLDEVLEELEEKSEDVIPGDKAFRLYDTYGLPLEITRDVAQEHGKRVDEEGYQEALEAQRRRAREAGGFAAQGAEELEYYTELLTDLQDREALGEEGVDYDPYSQTQVESSILTLLRDGERVSSVNEGDEVEVVLPRTCFYVESGGQVSDTGFIAAYDGRETEEWRVRVDDVRERVPGLIVHIGTVEQGKPHVSDDCIAVVDAERRMDIARNHTATHLLHNKLREILGEHVQQSGSLVSPDRLRFDFTHPGMLTEDELREVTDAVNEAILHNYPVETRRERYKKAVREGVIALFGEKYGDEVRVIRVGGDEGAPLSQELCGGTHVHETGAIGLFHIVSEESVGAGVRRIEAVTGRGAVELVERQLRILQRAAAYLKVSPEDVDRRALSLLDDLQSAEKEIERLEEKLARKEFEALLDEVETIDDVPLLSARVSAPSMQVLREMTDWFRDRLGSGVVVLGAVLDDRPAFVAAVTPDLVDRGANAAQLVREIAKAVGGGGGGRPTLAQAGGSDPSKLEEALQQAAGLLRSMLSSGE